MNCLYENLTSPPTYIFDDFGFVYQNIPSTSSLPVNMIQLLNTEMNFFFNYNLLVFLIGEVEFTIFSAFFFFNSIISILFFYIVTKGTELIIKDVNGLGRAWIVLTRNLTSN